MSLKTGTDNQTVTHKPTGIFERHLPAFGGCNFEWKALAANKVDIIVEDAAQIHEVVRVDRLDCVAYFFLEWWEKGKEVSKMYIRG